MSKTPYFMRCALRCVCLHICMSQSYELDEQFIGSCCTRCWLTQVESDMMCICMLPIFRWKCAVNMQEDGGEEKLESQVGLPLQH